MTNTKWWGVLDLHQALLSQTDLQSVPLLSLVTTPKFRKLNVFPLVITHG